MKRGMQGLVARAGVLAFLGMTVLAFWPAHGKYPFTLPASVLGWLAYSAYRRYAAADSDSFYVLAIGLVTLFSGMTLAEVGERHGVPLPVVVVVTAMLALLALGTFVIALMATGAADRYEE